MSWKLSNERSVIGTRELHLHFVGGGDVDDGATHAL